jgi:hypothetical protein
LASGLFGQTYAPRRWKFLGPDTLKTNFRPGAGTGATLLHHQRAMGYCVRNLNKERARPEYSKLRENVSLWKEKYVMNSKPAQ